MATNSFENLNLPARLEQNGTPVSTEGVVSSPVENLKNIAPETSNGKVQIDPQIIKDARNTANNPGALNSFVGISFKEGDTDSADTWVAVFEEKTQGEPASVL